MEPVVSFLYNYCCTEQDRMTKLEYSFLGEQNSVLSVLFSLDSGLFFEQTLIPLQSCNEIKISNSPHTHI